MVSKTFSDVSEDQSTTSSLRQRAEISFETILPSATCKDDHSESERCHNDVEMGMPDNDDSSYLGSKVSLEKSSKFNETTTNTIELKPKVQLDFDNLAKERCLPKDTLSMLMFTSSVKSRVCAFSVFVIQNTLYACVLMGLFVHDDYGSDCPHDANHMATQFCAIIIALVAQDNIRTSLNQWDDRFNGHLLIDFEGATQRKWLVASILRFWNGFTSLIVSFTLILDSDTVIDLLLNFTALEVICNFDNAVFIVAKEGYFGKSVQKDAFMIDSYRYYVEKVASTKFRWLLFFVFWLSMIIIWGFHVYGEHFCAD